MGRHDLVLKYAWAVPDEEVIKKIAAWSPIVEIGAGGGYWAKLIAESGGDIICFDGQPKDNPQVSCDWYPVTKGDHKDAARHSDRTLFLCWPPYATNMAWRCLDFYDGDRLIYIGEGYGGCNANDEFFKRLDDEWEHVDEYAHPQWDGIHDYTHFFHRSQ